MKATGRPTLVFVDEVHRFSKSQQDAFLPHVESGLFVFVGATTENPSFEVVSALLSRSTVYQLQSLSKAEAETLLDRAMTREFAEIRLTPEHATFSRGSPTGMRAGCSMPSTCAQRWRASGECRKSRRSF